MTMSPACHSFQSLFFACLATQGCGAGRGLPTCGAKEAKEVSGVRLDVLQI